MYLFESLLSILLGMYPEVDTDFWKSLDRCGQIAVENPLVRSC